MAPLPGVSSVVLGVVGFAFTAAYVEGGLTIIRRRVQWESEGRPLQVIEWGLPVGLVTSLLLSTAAVVGVVAGSLHLLVSADIPAVSELAARLLEL
jgi:hypothetical protein